MATVVSPFAASASEGTVGLAAPPVVAVQVVPASNRSARMVCVAPATDTSCTPEIVTVAPTLASGREVGVNEVMLPTLSVEPDATSTNVGEAFAAVQSTHSTQEPAAIPAGCKVKVI